MPLISHGPHHEVTATFQRVAIGPTSRPFVCRLTWVNYGLRERGKSSPS